MDRIRQLSRRRRAAAPRGRHVYPAVCALVASFAVAASVWSTYPVHRATTSLVLAGKTLPREMTRTAGSLAKELLQTTHEHASASAPQSVATGFVINRIDTTPSTIDAHGTMSIDFELFADAATPRAAQAAVEELRAALIAAHDEAGVTSAVLARELETARRAFETASAGLADSERELHEFERVNAAALPGLEDLNAQAIRELDRERAQLQAQLHGQEARRVELDRALADLQRGADRFGAQGAPLTSEILAAAQARWAVLRGRLGDEHPEALELGAMLAAARAAVDERVGALETELEGAQAAFESLQRRLPIDHPDVVSLAHRVSALERAVSEARVTGLSSRDLAQIENLSRERIAIDGEITDLRDRIAVVEQSRAERETQALRAPILEQQHLVLEQKVAGARLHLETQRETYEALSEAALAARSQSPGELMATGEIRTQRRLVNPLAALAGTLALPLGWFLALLVSSFERKRRTIYGADVVARLQGRPPLAVIPVLPGY